MRLPRTRERALVLTILRDQGACVVFPQECYRRADGFIAVHRDGLQELLHRRLYREVREVEIGVRKLERTCPTWGCCNPFHFALRAGLVAGTKRACPNGHAYAEVGRTPSGHCAVCSERRLQSRRSGGASGAAVNAAKTQCPRQHPYTPENTYRQKTPYGYRRRCRTCNRAATQMRRLHQDAR